jgi:cytochrome c oxidase subunit 4
MIRVIPLKNCNRSLIRFTLNSNKNLGHSAAPVVTGHHDVAHAAPFHPRIGKREIVGFGANGQPQYFDSASLPLPSVRWSEDTAEVQKLREKARGDRGLLSVEEKKACKKFFNLIPKII